MCNISSIIDGDVTLLKPCLAWSKRWCHILSFQVFIGLGFPYEGPAPLEAIAQGCIFLNAKVIARKKVI